MLSRQPVMHAPHSVQAAPSGPAPPLRNRWMRWIPVMPNCGAHMYLKIRHDLFGRLP
jgi:hypothetical protein